MDFWYLKSTTQSNDISYMHVDPWQVEKSSVQAYHVYTTYKALLDKEKNSSLLTFAKQNISFDMFV